MKRRFTWSVLLAATLLASGLEAVIAQKPATASLVPRDITMSVTVKGAGTFQTSSHETVSWSIDRTYIGSTTLNKALPFAQIPPNTLEWIGQLTKEVLTGDTSKQGVMLTYDHGIDPGGDKFVHSKVVVNDTFIRVNLVGRKKDGSPQYQTTTKTTKCDVIADATRLVNVIVDNAKATFSVRFPLGGHTKGLKTLCTETTSVKGKLTPPDPVDQVLSLYSAPPFPPVKEFKSLYAIDIPLGGKSGDEARKSFDFDTGDLLSDMQPFPGVKGNITVRAIYKLR